MPRPQSFVHGLNAAMYVGGALTLAAAFVAFFGLKGFQQAQGSGSGSGRGFGAAARRRGGLNTLRAAGTKTTRVPAARPSTLGSWRPPSFSCTTCSGSRRSGRASSCAVDAALNGRDALVVMPTGAGKSLCYAIPGLATEELTIVVSPLQALMRDQVEALRARGHESAFRLDSSLGPLEASATLAAVADGSCRLLYVAPERFADARFREAVSGRTVDLFAVDEAHCLSDWGHDFRPDYLRLADARDEVGGALHDGAHGDGDAPRRGGHRACAAAARPRRGRDRLRSPEPDVRRDPGAHRGREVAPPARGLAEDDGPPRTRLRRHAAALRGARRPAARRGPERRRLPRGPARRRARRGADGVHAGRPRRRRRDDRVRHGRRQGRRARGLALGAARLARGVLPGGGPRRARRRAGALRAAVRRRRIAG